MAKKTVGICDLTEDQNGDWCFIPNAFVRRVYQSEGVPTLDEMKVQIPCWSPEELDEFLRAIGIPLKDYVNVGGIPDRQRNAAFRLLFTNQQEKKKTNNESK